MGLVRDPKTGGLRRHPPWWMVMADDIGWDYVPPENHYLQFNGTTDFAYADGGATGYTTAYAMVVKMADAVPTSAGWPQYAQLVNTSTVDYRYRADSLRIRDGSPLQHYFRGIKVADGADNYLAASAGLGVCTGAQVHCIGRNLGTNAVAVRVIKASNQTVFYSADTTAAEDSSPDTVAIGATLKGDNTVSADAAYAAIKLVSVVFLDAVPSNALLQAYAAPTCRDARPIFGSSIKGYWTASTLAGSSIAALVGSVPITCNGPVVGDLVAL